MSIKGSIFQSESKNNRTVTQHGFSADHFVGYVALIPGQDPKIVNVLKATAVPSQLSRQSIWARLRVYGTCLSRAAHQDNTATATRIAANLDGSYGWDIAAALG